MALVNWNQNEWIDRPWHQKHSVKFGLRWESGLWNIGGFASYHSGWPTTDRVRNAGDVATSLYRNDLPSYFSLDLHIGRRVPTQHGELTFYADLLNSTNERNEGGHSYRAEDDEILRKPRRLFPIVPVIGIRWRW